MNDSVMSYFSTSAKMDDGSKMNKKTYSDRQKEMFTSFQQQQAKQQMKTSPSKTRELETVHKMGGDWFEPMATYIPSPSSNQVVWDMTNECYKEMELQQSPPLPFDPSWPQPYTCPPQFDTDVETPITLASSALPLVGLFGGVIMDFVDNLYTSSLVQYVCYKTRPSANRLAAETLARSNLNPNAKEFKPVTKEMQSEPGKFSPQAKEFIPEALELSVVAEESSPVVEGEQVFSDEEERLILEDIKILPEEESFSLVPTVQNNTDEMSVNNWEDVEQPESCRDNSKCDIEEGETWIGSQTPLEDSESEDWWDSDEEPGTPGQEIDPSEFEDLFPCGLLVSNLPCKSSRLPSELSTVTCNPPLKRESSPIFKSVACITLTCNPSQSSKQLDRVNRIFNEAFPDRECVKTSAVKVKFSDEIDYFYEPEELAQELAEARVSDFKQRQVDRERMERLLTPVFTTTHRKKMFSKIFGDL